MRWAVLLALAGLPAAAVLSWIFDWTREGVVRTPPAAHAPQQHRAVTVAALTLLIGALAWFAIRDYRYRTARTQLDEAIHLADRGKLVESLALAFQVEKGLPAAPALQKLWPEISRVLEVQTNPLGALVQIRPYGGSDLEWRTLGMTPIIGARIKATVAGDPPRSEAESEASRRLYERYGRSVAEVAQGPLRFYVEIHGNAHQDTAGRVEIATVGLTTEDAWQLKTLLELVRDAHLSGQPNAPKLEILVEPADTLRYTASASKAGGLLGRSERALHIELPKVARTTYRDAYTAVLADFLTQGADLLASARAK